MSRKGKKHTQRTSKKQSEKRPASPEAPSYPGWISPRTGLLIITLLSLAFGLFVGVQVYRKTSMMDVALRMGIGYGASIWAVFGLVLFITRTLRRRAL